jgi:uncharacterized protein (DUF305 family)
MPMFKTVRSHTLFFMIAVMGASLAAMAQNTDEVKKAFKEANDKMHQDMMMEPSGDADKDFAMMMIPHHEGAIAMAKAELQYGKDPQLRVMAEKIIAAQEAEIAELRKWQSEHPM